MLRSVALALGAVLAALLAAEGALRVLTDEGFLQRPFPNVPWLVVDPVAGWANRPGYRGDDPVLGEKRFAGRLAINALGLRGPETTRSKPPGRLRVACLGDSGTFGIWWRPSPADPRKNVYGGLDGYPEELRRLLRERGSDHVEVLNAGVIGYTSATGLRQLLTRIVDLEPDVVTVRFGFNDHAWTWNPALRAREPDSALARAFLYGFDDSKLMRLALAWRQRGMRWGHAENPEPWVPLPDFERNLRRFAEVARERGLALLFLDYPLRPLSWGEHPGDAAWLSLDVRSEMPALHANHAAYQEVLRSVARDESVPLLETRARFARRAPPLFGDADFVHPNSRGARVLARMLLARLDRLGWLAR